jgi:CRISPR/Cas system-associated exonuclease Cas4 (RecB family)
MLQTAENISSPSPRRAKTSAPAPRAAKTRRLYNDEATISFYEQHGRKRHCYHWAEKDLFIPGVTSVLRRLDKPMLLQWAANCAVECVKSNLYILQEGTVEEQGEILDAAKSAHTRIRDDAADSGKKVHAAVEALFRGEDLPVTDDPRVLHGIGAARKWLAENEVDVIEPERLLFSKQWLFAGTADLFAHVNGKLTIVDFKTSSGIYVDHLLQTAAYAIAEEEASGCRVQQRLIVRLDKKTGAFEAKSFPRSHLHGDAFLRLREMHELLTKIEAE